jgi:hypothetical protein
MPPTDAPAPHELAMHGPGRAHRAAGPDVSYLAARGLPLAYVDTRGSASASCEALADAAPQADVVLVHARRRRPGPGASSAAPRARCCWAPTTPKHQARLRLSSCWRSAARPDDLRPAAAARRATGAPRIASSLAGTADGFPRRRAARLGRGRPAAPGAVPDADAAAPGAGPARPGRRAATTEPPPAAPAPRAPGRTLNTRTEDPPRRLISPCTPPRDNSTQLDAQAVQPAGAPPGAPDDRQAAGQRRARRPDPGRHDRPVGRAVALRRGPGRAVRDLRHPAHPRRDARRAARQRLDEPRRPPPPAQHRIRGAQAGAAPRPRARRSEIAARWACRCRVPGAAGQGARHPAHLPGGHERRRGRRRLPRPPRGRRRRQPAGCACRTSACARRWSRRSRTCPSASSS